MSGKAPFVLQSREVEGEVRLQVADHGMAAAEPIIVCRVDAQILRSDPGRCAEDRSQLFQDLLDAYKRYLDRVLLDMGSQRVSAWREMPPPEGNA